jgi:hypothetical protein
MIQRNTQRPSSQESIKIENDFSGDYHSYYNSRNVAMASSLDGSATERLDIAV